jgi:hypothetical protein
MYVTLCAAACPHLMRILAQYVAAAVSTMTNISMLSPAQDCRCQFLIT